MTILDIVQDVIVEKSPEWYIIIDRLDLCVSDDEGFRGQERSDPEIAGNGEIFEGRSYEYSHDKESRDFERHRWFVVGYVD